MPSPPRIWTLSDRHAGNRNQASALAVALGGAERHVELAFPAPWRWLAPHLVAGAEARLPAPVADALAHRPPEIAIGCGRQAALALLALRRLASRPIFTVQILNPRIAPGAFDRVVVPRHDDLTGANVIQSTGALHSIDSAWIAQAAAEFPQWAKLPRPLLVVLIGGPHRHAALDPPAIERLGAELNIHRCERGGSIYLVGSRRTPIALHAPLRELARALDAGLWLSEGDGPNPYRGLLAQADLLLVSADSVGMLSEACALGVPVASFSAYPLTGKLARFDAALRAEGLLSDLHHPRAPSTPLRETPLIAAQVLAAWRDTLG